MQFQSINSEDLCSFLTKIGVAHTVVGDHRDFIGPAPIGKSEKINLTWSREVSADVISVSASVLILPEAKAKDAVVQSDKVLILVDNPRDTFRMILAGLYDDEIAFSKGLHDETMFAQTSENTWIAHSASVSKEAVLGADVIIHPNVTVYPGVSIGDNVEICSGCVIGAPGFGHVRQPNGALKPFPHLGGVVIGNDVSIGSNTCVDSGGLSPTMIGNGVRIGNLTQIAHNVEIDEDCLIGTRCQVAGGTKIGSGTEIWAGSTISNNRRIGRNCNIKIGSIVISHLPDNTVVSGNFAISHQRNLEIYAGLRDSK